MMSDRSRRPSPHEIRSLRERYGASQKAFGLILGFGELTINSYERGAPPAEANANLLRLVEEAPAFRRLYLERRGLLGPLQRRRIEAVLASLGKGSSSGADPVVAEACGKAPIDRLRERREELARRYGIRRLGVFGSRARGDTGADSDLDVLVELERPYKLDLLGFIGLELELSDELGVKVDLVNSEDLRPDIARRVLSEVNYL